MDLKNTVNLMCSDDYKKRFRAEYLQTKERYERLKNFNNRIEASKYSASLEKNIEMPKHDCPDGLLKNQQSVMADYLHILEVRALIEGIDLNEPFCNEK